MGERHGRESGGSQSPWQSGDQDYFAPREGGRDYDVFSERGSQSEFGGGRGESPSFGQGYGLGGPGVARENFESGSREYEQDYGYDRKRQGGRKDSFDREGRLQRDREEREGPGEGRRGRWEREAVTAGEVMTREVKAVTKQSSLQNVAQVMKDENCGIVPIVDESHKLLGVVTDRDLVIRTLAEGKSPMEVKVEEVMSDDVEVVTFEEELKEVVELMGRKQVRRIPVVDRDDRLVGIISMGDIANRADYDEDLQAALEKISSKRSFWSRLWS